MPAKTIKRNAAVRGRIKRRLAEQATTAEAGYRALQESREEVVCPLCDRGIPPAQRDAHHLIPKSKGGRETAWLHRICHRQIHALFTETELQRQYSSVEALKEHPEMSRFLAWVKKKPDDFFERTRKSDRIRGR